jgi:hypothetical protein
MSGEGDQRQSKRARTEVSPHGSRVSAVLQCRHVNADAPVLLSSCARTTQVDDAAASAAVVGGEGAAQPAIAGLAAATSPPGSNLPKNPEEWSADQVQQWFAEHNEGQWSQYAGKFAGLKGEQLCEMDKDDFLRFLDSDPHGGIIFNDVAKLKKQASSSSSENSPRSAAGTAAALTAPLAPCFGFVPCSICLCVHTEPVAVTHKFFSWN